MSGLKVEDFKEGSPIEDSWSKKVIGAAIEVHKHLGPGLLESAYSTCLSHELSLQGIPFHREVPLPLNYKGVVLETAYRLDFVVGESLILEIKAMEKLEPVHQAQLLTYLRLSGKRIGLLLNFNVPVLKDGILRRVL
jgi:GxxExxY protein